MPGPIDEAVMNERRTSSRKKAFLQGRIFFNNRRTSIDCLIRDLSEQGAKLKFSSAVVTPDLIELYIPNKDESYRARVQWRAAEDIGVVFDVDERVPLVPGAAPADWAPRIHKLEHDLAVLQRKFNELQSAIRLIQGAD
jgi:hypothetical protein